jgi:hypothetical protein
MQGKVKQGACAFKPRLRVTCGAEDRFLIGQEGIWQGCDYPENGKVF